MIAGLEQRRSASKSTPKTLNILKKLPVCQLSKTVGEGIALSNCRN